MTTVLIELPVGLLLLAAPAALTRLLLGATLDTAASSTVARIAGAALLAVSVACWTARDDAPGHAVRGVIVAVLVYNCLAALALAHAGAVLELAGVLLWPAVALHLALAVWCGVTLGAPSAPPTT
jgi:hypothetical protein